MKRFVKLYDHRDRAGKYRKLYLHETFMGMIKRWIRTAFRYFLISFAVTVFLFIGGAAGSHYFPKIEYTQIEKVVLAETESPVLDRIAMCESDNMHIGKNGQVVVHGNTNGSVDVGRYQINVQIWGQTATDLGYDIFTDEGNTNMAQWLFKNKGSEPWVYSKKCWIR